MTPETISHLDDVIFKLQQEKVCLFIGAGISNHAGLPTGAELSQNVKSHFKKADQTKADFMDICDDVLETIPYTRAELNDFIKRQLEGYRITDEHTKLTKLNWAAIFTTNFDDIIESAYTQSHVKIKSCIDIYENKPSIGAIIDKNKVPLFKIMGSVRVSKGEGEMVLSTTDLDHSFLRRQAYYTLLKDYLKNGCIVFLGYSFNDKIVKQAIDDIIRFAGGIDLLPYSYAVFRSPLPDDEKTQNFFRKRKIIPITIDFKSFIEYVDENLNSTSIKITSTNYITLTLKGKNIRIKESDFINYSTNFDFLHNEIFSNNTVTIEDYFKGDINKWEAYKNNWDFVRDCYMDEIYHKKSNSVQLSISQSITSELKKLESDKNKVILIKGMPGSGKSVLLRRIAYDIYSNKENPVIILNNKLFNYDRKLISGFIENIREIYNSLFAGGELINTLKFVIIVDDISSKLRDVLLLKDFLTSRGRSVLFIAAGRSNYIEDKSLGIHPDLTFEIPEFLGDQEIPKISKHFIKLGFTYISLPRLQDLIKREYDKSFFATIYSIVHPSRKPLDEIIKDQYNSLPPQARLAFEFICCFSQFNIPINIELLVRSLDISYSTFIDDILKSDSKKIIFQEADVNGNIFLRAHHSIIAKKTIDFFLRDSKPLLDRYIKIFSSANFSIDIEREICEKIIIDHLKGRESRYRNDLATFTNGQLTEIFDTICVNNATRSLLHHHALLLQEEKDYDSAADLLQRALEDSSDGDSFFSAESDQNILTSLGTLNSKLGQEALRKNLMVLAEKHFTVAEDYYRQAKYTGYSDAHAYHSHAFMYFIRGQRIKETGSEEYLKHFASALEILSTAKDNMNDDNLLAILELEEKIYDSMGDENNLSRIIEIMRDKFNSAKGYYIVSLRLLNEGFKLKAEGRLDDASHKFKLADEKIRKGLRFFPNDEDCLVIKCKLNKERKPNDYDLQYGDLNRWNEISTFPNVRLMYELGRVSFIMEFYDISRSIFDELQKGPGFKNKDRSRAANPIIDGLANQPAQFEGKILNIYTLYDGDLQANSLKGYRGKIAFAPIACKFTPAIGNLVRFNISFSFRGPVAENLVRI